MLILQRSANGTGSPDGAGLAYFFVWSTSTTPGGITDTTGIQLGALLNRTMDELRRVNRWTALQCEFDLVVVPPIATTGDLLALSPVIQNIPSTAGVQPNDWTVAGPGIPVAARILSVDSPTQITMLMENTNV